MLCLSSFEVLFLIFLAQKLFFIIFPTTKHLHQLFDNIEKDICGNSNLRTKAKYVFATKRIIGLILDKMYTKSSVL